MHKARQSNRKASVRTANRVHLRYSVNVEFRRRIDAQAGSIRLRINHQGQQVRFAIPSLSNTPVHVWNRKNNQIHPGSTDADRVFSALSTVQKHIEEAFLKAQEDIIILDGNLFYYGTHFPYLPMQTLKAAKEYVLDPQSVFARKDFLYQKFSEFIASRAEDADHIGKPLAYSTIQQYTCTCNNIREFEELYGKITLKMLAKGNKSDFFRVFSDFISTHKNYQDNSKSKLLKQLNTFIIHLQNSHILPYTLQKFICGDAEKNSKPKIALTMEELDSLFHMQGLPECLERVRKMFLIVCWTGARYSDWSKLISHYQGPTSTMISFIAKKNNALCIVPIVEQIRPFLEHFKKNGIPTLFSNTNNNSKVNKALKDIFKIAGLTREIMFNDMSTHVLQDIVTTHSARATLVTQYLLKGLRPQQIITITGHRSVEELEPYMRISAEDLTSSVRATANMPELNPDFPEESITTRVKSEAELLEEFSKIQALNQTLSQTKPQNENHFMPLRFFPRNKQ